MGEKKRGGFWGENCALHFMFCWNYLILGSSTRVTWAFPEVLYFRCDSHKDWKHREKNPGGRIEAAWFPFPQLITHSALGHDQDMGSSCGVLVWYWTASRCRSALGQHSLLINHPAPPHHSNTSTCHDIWLDFSGNFLDPKMKRAAFGVWFEIFSRCVLWPQLVDLPLAEINCLLIALSNCSRSCGGQIVALELEGT